MSLKKRTVLGLVGAEQAALSAECQLFKKLPRVMEFITALKFADGDPREPGYYTTRNRKTAFEVTLYDPSNGLRLPVRAVTHTDAWFLVEKLLGVEDAPWEVDRYLMEELEKKERIRTGRKRRK